MEAAPTAGDSSQDTAGETQGNTRHPVDWDNAYNDRLRTTLRLTLELAIPLWADRAKAWPSETRWKHIRAAGDAVAYGGDTLLFRTKARKSDPLQWSAERGYTNVTSPMTGTAPTFNALAMGLGCLLLEKPDAVEHILNYLTTEPV
jgi:hypothetical protein